jgi:hypothetical protein
MHAMLTLKLRHSDLRRLEVMHLSHLLDLTLLMPTFPLLLLHLPVVQPPPLPLRLCKKTLKFYQIPGMLGAVVRYTLFALVCYLNKFYFGLLVY